MWRAMFLSQAPMKTFRHAGEDIWLLLCPGAGKSSLVAALLRLAEIVSGDIAIDGCSVSSVPLRRLRSALGVVPQTAFLFEVTGTLVCIFSRHAGALILHIQ